ncbi:MAG TPA: hypothetical protein VF808_16030 [Ktedonobacterales bacterium]
MLALLVKYKLTAISAALLGVAGMGGLGVAAASGALPLNALQAFQAQQGATGNTASARWGLARHILHGAVVLPENGAWITYTLDVGRVTSVSATAISLTRADGSGVTLTVSPATRWGQRAQAPKDLARLAGREVAVLSLNGAAVHVGGRGILKGFAYADLTLYRNGQTREIQLDRGVVRSVSATQISLTRADGVILTLTLSPHARYRQAGVSGPVAASAVQAGEYVTLLVVNHQVTGVRIAAATSASAA